MKDEFNYKNMENELLHAVWEEETIQGIQGESILYQQAVANQKGMSKIKEQGKYDDPTIRAYAMADFDASSNQLQAK